MEKVIELCNLIKTDEKDSNEKLKTLIDTIDYKDIPKLIVLLQIENLFTTYDNIGQWKELFSLIKQIGIKNLKIYYETIGTTHKTWRKILIINLFNTIFDTEYRHLLNNMPLETGANPIVINTRNDWCLTWAFLHHLAHEEKKGVQPEKYFDAIDQLSSIGIKRIWWFPGHYKPFSLERIIPDLGDNIKSFTNKLIENADEYNNESRWILAIQKGSNNSEANQIYMFLKSFNIPPNELSQIIEFSRPCVHEASIAPGNTEKIKLISQ